MSTPEALSLAISCCMLRDQQLILRPNNWQEGGVRRREVEVVILDIFNGNHSFSDTCQEQDVVETIIQGSSDVYSKTMPRRCD